MGSCNGVFHAVDTRSGKAVWTYRALDDVAAGRRAEFHGEPLVTNDLVLTGSDDRDPGGAGFVYAFDRDTGRVRWKRPAARGVMGNVLRHGSRVFAVSLADELLCLDLATGRILWTHRGAAIPEDALAGFNTTPALAGARVYFGSQDGTVSALDAEDGKVLWKRDVGAPVVTPVTTAGDLYLVTRSHRLLRLDSRDGRILGEITLPAHAFGPVVPAGDGLLVLVGDRRKADQPALSLHRYAASLVPAQPTWTHELPGGWTSSRPYVVDHSVVGGGEHGDMVRLRLADGKPIWADRLKGVIRGIGHERGRFFVGTLSGTLYAYEPPTRP
jgi:eukaryotic-like serine/threonine-protein kinase